MAKQYFVLSSWSTLIENLTESPLQFYERVEGSITQRQVPDIKITKTDLKEGHLFSAKRQYLTVNRKRYLFDVCGAPFGTGFFVSWWLSFSPTFFQRLAYALSEWPFFGSFITTAIGDNSFYKRDTTQMFQTAIHSAVLDVVDQITKMKGLRALSEGERKPIHSEFFAAKTLQR